MPILNPSRLLTHPAWRRLVACIVMGALAGVFTAPLWHRHEEGRRHGGDGHTCHNGPTGPDHERDRNPGDAPRHGDCDICLIIHTPLGDGLCEPPLIVPAAPGVHPRWLGDERWAVLWVGRDRASRGPPVC